MADRERRTSPDKTENHVVGRPSVTVLLDNHHEKLRLTTQNNARTLEPIQLQKLMMRQIRYLVTDLLKTTHQFHLDTVHLQSRTVVLTLSS